ncbi:MAG TPA: cyclic nucleotide-binding domain-containing protein [Polyangiaceae bacterium]|jgi:CRP-like cAMP-binding protein|nr:cyclic nucleotide-binding domain-containing protein [Polyangiaceae bacterium]
MSGPDAQRVKRELLMRSLFPSMPAAAHVRFIELLEDLELAAGEQAFAQGDAPDHFMFLTEGRVVLEMEGSKSIEFSGFSVIGVVDAVLERPRQRACRALVPSKALVIRSADWFDLLEDNAEVARAAIKNFATQLHELWLRLSDRLPRHSEPPPGIIPSALEPYDRILALRQASFLRRAGMQAIASLAIIAETLFLKQSQSLFETGNDGENFFVVASGLIEITHISGQHFTHDAGDLVGGPAAFCNALPSYSARASNDAVVLRIPQQDFYDQAEEHGRLLRGTLAYLATELEIMQGIA